MNHPGKLFSVIDVKSHDLLACGFSVTILKVSEHHLCECLRIAAQHVTNHEVLDYADLSLKGRVIVKNGINFQSMSKILQGRASFPYSLLTPLESQVI